jgi:peptidoglycan hydrolase-like protein with peptidoglycan-binding domain
LAKLGLNVNKIDNDKKDDDKKTEDKAEEKIPEDICPADQILTQNLRSGSRNGRFNAYTGAVVTQANILQAHLNRLGFNSGPVDGILGRLSDGAIRRMQTFLGTRADGFVGPVTRGLINKSCGSKGLQN